MKTRLTSSEREALKKAFYNASGSCSGKILNTLWQELPPTVKESIEEILNSTITVELPCSLTEEQVRLLLRGMDDMIMR